MEIFSHWQTPASLDLYGGEMRDCSTGVKYRIGKEMKEKETERKRESLMGPDIHSTDSDRYDSKERGLWYTYKGRLQIRYHLTACNTVPITLYVR